MLSSSSGAPPTSPEAAEANVATSNHAKSIAERRAAHLALVRAMPASQYVATQTAEVLAAAIVAAPAVFFVATVAGVLGARFPPVQHAGAPPSPPVPRTAGGLLSAGLRSGASATLRTCMWAGGTAALAATLREGVRVGPRHEVAGDSGGGRAALWINAAAGGAVAYAILGAGASAPMVLPRRLLYSTMGSMAGVLLPQTMAIIGPGVRKQLVALLGGAPPSALG